MTRWKYVHDTEGGKNLLSKMDTSTKLDLTKLRQKYFISQDSVNKVKTSHNYWEKITVVFLITKRLVSILRKGLLQINKKDKHNRKI